MSRWAALAIASLVAGVALVAAMATSSKDDGGETPPTECEQAYADGLGNAATSDRASWIADCEAELNG